MGEEALIAGRRVRLDGEETPRSVWLGRLDDGFAVEFVNAEGDQTRLWLSPEALEGLHNLYKAELAHPAAEEGPEYYVATFTGGDDSPWRVERTELPGEEPNDP